MTAMMKIDLVTAEKGQPMTTSLAIADGVGIAHRAILQLLKNHMSHFEGFGRVAFEMRPFLTAGGQQVRRVAVLNEQHATLLMTFLKNSEKVVQFKVALVRAFFDARALLQSGCLSLLEQRAALCAVYESEKQQASVHGSGLNQWKHHKQGLQSAIAQVEAQIQPLLTHWPQ